MFAIRRACVDDIDTLVDHRRSMFYDMGHCDSAVLDAMAARFRPWLRKRMIDGDYLAWVATTSGAIMRPAAMNAGGFTPEIISGAGLWLMDWPPHVVGSGARRGNIVNVYTEHAHRRKGIARRLMDAILKWCRDNGVDAVVLHSSPEGRPLYESMGFEATNEMRLLL